MLNNTDIFYVEDDMDFAFIMESALMEVKKEISMQIIENGNDALLRLEELSVRKVKPKLILLDLNLPGISGLDLLKQIKDMPFLRYVPVILFSTSDNPQDIKSSLEFGANAFVSKPSGYTELIVCLQSMYDFWFVQNARLN
jgi:CheY-like chemotaxis protein